MEEKGTREITGKELRDALYKISCMELDEQRRYFFPGSGYALHCTGLEHIIRTCSAAQIMEGINRYDEDQRELRMKECKYAMREIINKVGYSTAKEILEETAEEEGRNA